MNVKRFVASSMQEALKQVREELGADAVILSNERIDEGVEVVAALEYDEESASADFEAEGQPSPSKVARLHAQKQIRLQNELGKARQHIESTRQRRQSVEKPRPAVASQQEQADDFIRVESSDQSKALSEVRAEIESLKGLLSQQLRTAPAAAPVMDVVQQQVQKRLSSLCIAPSVQTPLLQSVKGVSEFDQAWSTIKSELARGLSPEYGEIIDQGGVIALVGPTGSGKTMTIGKLAARYVMKFGADSIALVTTDRFRIAAHEQLRVFGRILNIPVHAVDEQHGLDCILDKLSDKKLVLVDTAGLLPNDPKWAQQLQELKMSAHRVQSYLVVPAVGQYQVMCSNHFHYRIAQLAGTIVTKIDEAVSLGEVLSFLIDSRLKLAYVTDGQRVPEDIHRPDAAKLVDRAEALLNTSERWVTIHSPKSEAGADSVFSYSA